MPGVTDARTPADCPERRAVDRRNELVTAWLERTDEEFERIIRIAGQQAARARRDIDPSDETYWTGWLDGIQEVLTELFRERLRQNAI